MRRALLEPAVCPIAQSDSTATRVCQLRVCRGFRHSCRGARHSSASARRFWREHATPRDSDEPLRNILHPTYMCVCGVERAGVARAASAWDERQKKIREKNSRTSVVAACPVPELPRTPWFSRSTQRGGNARAMSGARSARAAKNSRVCARREHMLRAAREATQRQTCGTRSSCRVETRARSCSKIRARLVLDVLLA